MFYNNHDNLKVENILVIFPDEPAPHNMAGVMLSNTNIARKIQEEALGSPLVVEDDSSQSAPTTPIIDFRKLPEFNPLNAGLGPDFRLSRLSHYNHRWR